MSLRDWRRPEVLLVLMAVAAPISFSTWQALLDNFSIHQAGFTGREIGILQSLREIPGFLAFTVVFVLLLIREQALAFAALILLGIGTALTGGFPTVVGLYLTTMLMSVGFHYFYTVETSLCLQWIDKERTPEVMGQLVAASSVASIIAFFLVWLTFDYLDLGYVWVYAIGGGLTAAIGIIGWIAYPRFPEKVRQHRKMVLRSRYWLYYALEFMSGARRQIFIVFAGFLLVQKFEYDVSMITLLFLLNAILNVFCAAWIGRMIARFGERNALVFEYVGLVVVFTAYALVESAAVAGALYVIDHLFFAMAIAIKTYFQKIADPADMASTAGVSFTIGHIAAVVLPAVFGIVWLLSPALVFLSGAAMAVISLALAFKIPRNPQPGNEVETRTRLMLATS